MVAIWKRSVRCRCFLSTWWQHSNRNSGSNMSVCVYLCTDDQVLHKENRTICIYYSFFDYIRVAFSVLTMYTNGATQKQRVLSLSLWDKWNLNILKLKRMFIFHCMQFNAQIVCVCVFDENSLWWLCSFKPKNSNLVIDSQMHSYILAHFFKPDHFVYAKVLKWALAILPFSTKCFRQKQQMK